MRDLVIIGAGGFGREVRRWASVSREDWGFTVAPLRWDSVVLINSDELPKLPNKYVAVVTIGDPATRRKVVEGLELSPHGLWSPRISALSADISDIVFIDRGTIICQNSVINVNVRIGEHVHVNMACTIGHDCIIGDFVTISPGVHISGNVTVGDEVFIGTGAVIREKLTIGKGATIGMGAVVVKDVPAGVTVVGNPAREMK